MDEKEFEERLQKHRKEKNKKIGSYVFLVIFPALIGTFIVIIASTQAIEGGTTYDISAIAPHESSIDHYSRDVHLYVSHSIFFSPNPEISWSANYVGDFNSPAPLRFRVIDNLHGTTHIDTTTSSYQEKLSGVDSNTLDFNWINEDESQDVYVGCRIHYDLDLFWVAFFMFIGIILIAHSCISAQKISNRTKRPSENYNRTK